LRPSASVATIVVAARRKPSGGFYSVGTGGLAPFRFLFPSFNPLAPYENHTIFSLPSFSKRPRFVNASKLGSSSELQLGNHRPFFRTLCGAKV
jgi:hypothetical protein